MNERSSNDDSRVQENLTSSSIDEKSKNDSGNIVLYSIRPRSYILSIDKIDFDPDDSIRS